MTSRSNWIILLWLLTIQLGLCQGITILGRVEDQKTGLPLAYANVGIVGKTLGTGTNSKGEFSLKLTSFSPQDSLQISFIGYELKRIAIKTIQDFVEIKLQENTLQLKEVAVRPWKAFQLMEEVVKRIPENYDSSATLLKGFYRETVKADCDPEYILYAEGVLDVYKNSYQNLSSEDAVKVEKGRVKYRRTFYTNQQDTIRVPEITQGPSLGVILDIIKNPSFFIQAYKQNFFEYDSLTSYEGRPVYTLKFSPRRTVNTNQFLKGKLYIDYENLAIIGADFEYTPSGYFAANMQATARIELKNRQFRVSYEHEGTRWYMKGASVDNIWQHRKGKAFLYNKMVFLTTDHLTKNIAPFDTNEILKRDTSLGYSISFEGDNFWEDYNILRSEDETIKKKNE
ncbi:MAG: carboxypeptidase-like regulatory domain-containing protein [Spirosomataceae bacterium]